MEMDLAHPGMYRFSSSSITVTCGGSVALTNNSDTTHTFSPTRGGFADTGNIDRGKKRSVRMSYRGTYGFMCMIHNYMKGTVHVT